MDVTKENNPKTFKWVYVHMLPIKDYAFVCGDLFRDSGLSNCDEIGFY